MPVRNIKVKRPRVWIPPTVTANWRVTIKRLDGTVDDVTDILTRLEIEDGVTENIGRFTLEFPNPNETFSNIYSGNEEVTYYSDYASTASTPRFLGSIEKPSKVGFALRITGRGFATKVMDLTVTQSFTAIAASEVLKSIFTTYASSLSQAGIETSTTLMTVNWFQKPFWEAVEEIAIAAGFMCYINAEKTVQFFEIDSRINTAEAIVHEHNLIEVKDFTPDITFVRNRIIIYGATQEGTQIVYTAEDSTGTYSTSSVTGVKEEIINDGNITNFTQAQELGDALLLESKTPPEIGEVMGVLLSTIQPGEMIRLSSPGDNIQPGNYRILSYKHDIGLSGTFTTVRVTKEPRKISHLLRGVIQRQSSRQETFINPFEMRFSYNFLFNSDSGTHTNTEITQGVLKLELGESSGNWVSPTRILADDLTEAYLILNGEKLDGAVVEVSGNNGTTFQTVQNLQKINVSSAAGINLVIKITFSDADTRIDSVSLLYKID